MKLERLNDHTLKIFLTLDDLYDNGLTVEEIKENRLKVHAIIQGMVENACAEMDFQMVGSIQIEIFALHSQGLIMIVKREEDLFYEDLVDLHVYLDEKQQMLYAFTHFEDVVQLSVALKNSRLQPDSNLYFHDGLYYLFFYNVAERSEVVSSLAAEFGYVSTMSIFYLKEYGKTIIENTAIRDINRYFR